MIDVHCHIIPGVDDGASSLEEALEMLKMAKEDGITSVVATPHRNHPTEFREQQIESSFKQLQEEVANYVPEIQLYLGSEFYVREDYLHVLDTLTHEIGVNGTNYAIIEFKDSITKEEVYDIIHEFKVRGYRPIIAHIERYENLIQDIKTIKEMKSEGAFLQITGSSVLGKQGKEVMVFVRKLIQQGLIDFIATDAHGKNKRRMRLLKVYKMVQRLTSEEECNRIFKRNPNLLIQGERLMPTTLKKKKYPMRRSKLNLVATAVGVSLIFFISIYFFTPKEVSLASDGRQTEESVKTFLQDIDHLPIQVIQAKEMDIRINLETDKQTNTERDTMVDEKKIEKVNIQYEQIEKVETIEESAMEPIFVKEDIEGYYREKLESLKAVYQNELAVIIEEIKVARDGIKDLNKKQDIIKGYLGEIELLEVVSDNDVYQILYEMQNDLEEGDYSIEQVEAYRKEYHGIKESTKREYLSNIKIQ